MSIQYPGTLHAHSEYSNIRLRDSTNKLDKLIWTAAELGNTVLGLTDHDCLSGHMKAEYIYKEVKKKYPNFKLIRGNEIYLCRNGLNTSNFNSSVDKYYHFILLAKNLRGHQQLREISTKAWLRSYMARGMRRVPTYYQDLFDIIGADPGHVIGTTACLGGAIGTQLLKWRASKDASILEKVEIWLLQMDDLFGHGNFYLELQPSFNNEQIFVNKVLLELSKKLNIPYIITTDAHYLRKEDRYVHKAYLNAQNGDREVDDFYATTYLMNTEEIESYFKYLSPEQLAEAYRNIERIAAMCEDYTLTKPLKIPELVWKEPKHDRTWLDEHIAHYSTHMPMLAEFYNASFYGDRRLAELVVERVATDKTLQNNEAYYEINDNLKITKVSSDVNKAHWSSYYLNLQKIIDLCWEANSVVGPGRGSGVGFILLYVLDITQINPLRETTRTFSWRFLNPERVSVLDVDFDIEGVRRNDVLNMFRKFYGQDRVANVITFGTEKSKSAILTAARGLNIDVDTAQYISSLIPADRGMLRTLDQCMYGDEENGFTPIKQFVIEMTDNYPELWNVARNIEGLICRSGIHAGGVIFVDEEFTNSTSLMRAPDGTIVTAFELHDSEAASLIKYDALSVEAMDKIHNCLDLLCEYGFLERKETLRETYENAIGIYNLERKDADMWHMIWDHRIESLFQMEQASGIQGIALTKPESVDDLAVLNSVLRLMAQEKGAEQPLNKFARFKNNIDLWYQEMRDFGLTPKEMAILEPVVKISYGICESQEKFMQLVQLPECGGFDLTWADSLRKSIAKKNPAAYEKLTKEYFERVKERGLSYKLCAYVWNVLVATSRGYGFNASHTLAYSLIALQEMNLAHVYPIIFWNCACLISDSGGNEKTEDEEVEDIYAEPETYSNEMEEFTDEDEADVEDSYNEEDCDGMNATVMVLKDGKKKKKVVSNNYGKIASAIGKMKMHGIDVSAPDINLSRYTFSPDVEQSIIRYGISGIVRIGEDLIQSIIANRPYTSLQDFLDKIKINKPQMINLIKAGCFDSLGNRTEIMRQYIYSVSDVKKRITLQNMKMLIDFGLIPDEYDMQRRVYNFNKYIKKLKLGTTHYGLDTIAFNFYSTNFDIDLLETENSTESGFKIKQTFWDAYYKKHMDIIRPYVQKHAAELLVAVNDRLVSDLWNKYCSGTISKWEMDSLSCYIHEHELEYIDEELYGLSDFFELPEEPEIDRYIPIKGKMVPIFKLHRIAGTVLDKNKSKNTVTLLTRRGVVTVKIYGGVFAQYDKQISERGADGKKHVIERSMFQRGNKIIVTGVRDGDGFRAKKYKYTPWHLVEQITNIAEDGTLTIRARGEQE